MQPLRERKWLVYAIGAALCWGAWGVLAKLNSETTSPYVTHLLFTVGMLATLPFAIRRSRVRALNAKGIFWGVLAGVLATVGNLAVYFAFGQGGRAAIVIAVSSLYPLVTVALALGFLGERLWWPQVLGIGLAVPAFVLLSGQPVDWRHPDQFFAGVTYGGWFGLTLLALVLWGVFSTAQKVATNFISAEWCYACFIGASALLTLGFFAAGTLREPISLRSAGLGAVAGAFNGLGVLLSFSAYRSEGKASLVTVVAGALQPVFTLGLALLFLGETIGVVELVGIAFAVGGAMLLSVEKSAPAESLMAWPENAGPP